jgi:hypothetical protein
VPGQVMAADREAGTLDVLTGDGALVLSVVELDGARGPASAAVPSLRARLLNCPRA